MEELLPFSTALMGSWPRSEKVLQAKKDFAEKTIDATRYQQIIDAETERIVGLQENAGIDLITDGELARDNYISYVAEKVAGIKIMDNEAILANSSEEYRKSFAESLKTRDAKDADFLNPIAYDKIDTEAELNAAQVKKLKTMTNQPVKVTLPSPYLLTRSLWLTGLTDQAYANRESLGKDISKLICQEVQRLIDLGVATIQLDDPVLTQIVFSDEEDQTFY